MVRLDHRTMARSSLRFTAVTLLGFVLALSAGCRDGALNGLISEEETYTPKLVIVLVDRSGSTKADRPIYERAMDVIRAALRGGDRLIVAPITDASGTDFANALVYDLPAAPGAQSWTDQPIEYRKAVEDHAGKQEALEETMQSELSSFLGEEIATGATTIFESIRIAEPMLVNDDRRKFIVILSDMKEESASVNLDKRVPTDESTAKEIERQKSVGILPDLSGVSVYVVGAVGSPPEKSAAIERFWMSYFESSGATMDKGQYARVLTAFPE